MKSLIRNTVLFLALSVAFGIAVAQQPESASPVPTTATQAEPQTTPAQAEPHTPQGTAQPASEGKQSRAETQKGNKEGLAQEEESEEENASLKYSPAVTKLGKMIGMGPKGSYWLFTGLNFAVVIGAIVWFVKSKLLSSMRERNVSIRAAMEAAKKASDEANTRLAGIEARLTKIDGEVAAIKVQAEADFKIEEQRIQQQAAQDAKHVVEAAEQEIAAAAKSARRDLKVFAADLAVNLAEKKISVDRDTDENLVRSFVDQFGKDGK
jgi:F-type H+-transporting ATPase subunit b